MRGRRTSPLSDGRLVPAQTGTSMFDAWHWAAGAILASSAVLRLILLDLKPLHHDEGVNGLFLTTLFRDGYYHYDPSNYHGPTLYYFAWITTTINSFFYGKDGLSTFAIRLLTALFGIGIIWLILCLRRQLGNFGALAAAALAAVSPGMVFFSRYFIHEILFVFFSLAVVVTILRFRRTGQPRYLMLASVSAALLCATKETWIITIAVWLIALPCTTAYLRLRKIPEAPHASNSPRASQNALSSPAEATRDRDQSRFQLYAAAALLFAAVWVLLYSSFFTNFPTGVYDSVRTFGYWLKTGESSPHTSGWTTYFVWLFNEEAPVLILGAMGVITALAQATNRFAIFVAFWSLGTLAAYSLVSYKTPWNALNIILPLTIVAGYGLEQLYRSVRPLSLLVVTIAVGVSLYQATSLTFFHYDDDAKKYVYVYAHTRRDFLSLINEIGSVAAGNPAGKDIGIVVMSPEHWPLPWYLRDYTHVGYWGKVIETSEPILVVREDQVPEVEQTLGNQYRLISNHDLRPGVRLYLYLRRDLQQLSKQFSNWQIAISPAKAT